MSAADCLRLRHRGRGRRRYSLRFEEPIDWSALADTLRVRLTGTPFRFRLNPLAQSVVISGISASNDQDWQPAAVALVAALEEIGAAAPAPEVITIPLRNIATPLRQRPERRWRWLVALLGGLTNLMTVSLSLLLTLTAFSLILIGVPGLLLPLSPGALLLLLAAWLIELAFLLRRPFIASAH
ncbi:hypothetical protein SynWH8101_0694 [Synechococcus sp. WH 8101]|uniref:hypothetical protein n=1 Tax=Synechococcus sp. WH 8101 TaxID=59932 RepID=UPI0010239F2C|nr:hypothetical protein [Synechococcus sp. WH 8101]QBE68288.1 hypothetical protein SynWH8101_0694 [Synechococcus sp. WH 8101]QNI44500.1 putative conserved membrane protein [Synechococcus sp. WH 8101]